LAYFYTKFSNEKKEKLIYKPGSVR